MHDTIISILQWLIPSGGLGVAIGWLTSRTLREARTSKEAHDAYRAMYESVRATLIQLQDDNNKLHQAVALLQRAVHSTARCPHLYACPVRVELRKQAKDCRTTVANGSISATHRPRDANIDESKCDSGYSTFESDGGEPP